MTTNRTELMDSELNNISGGKFSFITHNGTVTMQSDRSRKHAGKVYTFDQKYITDVNAYITSHDDFMTDDQMIDALLKGVSFTNDKGHEYTVKIKKAN